MGILKKLKKKRSRRALSPVIATVILFAFVLIVSIAVSYWMGGVVDSTLSLQESKYGHFYVVK